LSLLQNLSQLRPLLAFEQVKARRQHRLLFGLGVVGVMTALCLVGIYLRISKASDQKAAGFEFLLEHYVNGVNFSIVTLGASLLVILPMVLGVFTASSLAGEIQAGQIRIMALRPVSKWAIFLSKYLSLCGYCFSLLLGTLLLSYAVGALVFGVSGDIFVWDPGIIGGTNKKEFFMKEAVAWQRYGLIYFLSFFTLCSLVAYFLMCAALLKRTASAIALPLGLYFACHIAETMPIMDRVCAYLPTKYLFLGKYSMDLNMDWRPVMHDGMFLCGFTLVFLVVGGIAFCDSDL